MQEDRRIEEVRSLFRRIWICWVGDSTSVDSMKWGGFKATSLYPWIEMINDDRIFTAYKTEESDNRFMNLRKIRKSDKSLADK